MMNEIQESGKVRGEKTGEGDDEDERSETRDGRVGRQDNNWRRRCEIKAKTGNNTSGGRRYNRGRGGFKFLTFSSTTSQ